MLISQQKVEGFSLSLSLSVYCSLFCTDADSVEADQDNLFESLDSGMGHDSIS